MNAPNDTPQFEDIYVRPVEIVKTPDLHDYSSEERKAQEEALSLIQKGDLDSAIALYEPLFKNSPSNAATGNILAALLSHQGDFLAATRVLRKILKKDPQDIIALNNMACCQMKLFDYSPKTKQLIEKALKHSPNIAELQHNLGIFFHRQHQYLEATRAYNTARLIKTLPETLTGIGLIYLHTNDIKAAKPLFTKALELTPKDDVAFYGLSIVREKEDHISDAMHFISHALCLVPDHYAYIERYKNLCRKSLLPIENNLEKEAALHFLRYKKTFHQRFFSVWQRTILSSNNPDTQTIRHYVSSLEEDINPTKTPLLFKEINQEFFWRGIKELLLTNLKLENIIIKLRRYFLTHINVMPLEDIPLDYLYAQAELCFFNEYIYDITEEEQQLCKTLKKEFIEKKHGTQHKELISAVIASYEPLYQSSIAQAIKEMQKSTQDERFKHLIAYQISEPSEEFELKKKIKTFGSISNDVSQKVKEQYESNPYPRWKNISDYTDETKQLIEKRGNKKTFKALIAGCGTGRQVVEMLSNTPDAKLTAIDISASSIAYAQRKVNELGFKNVRFYIGDILELDQLNEHYDHITCTGVLHHMDDPMAGWKALCKQLKPGGQMHIALYSELARQPVVAARELIKEQAIDSDIDGIKEVRRYIQSRPPNDPLRGLIPSNDFYSTSMLRDLIFHVQEHRYTIPMIKFALETLGLEFKGFEKETSDLSTFQQMNNSEQYLDLDAWGRYEQENPTTFRRMYNFACKKIHTPAPQN